MIGGILIVDKPVGLTSHDVVSRLRRILRTKKIGHTGTLDPFATGVLVMLVGKATRLARFLDKDEKSYEALVRFGFETDTGDKTGTRKEAGEDRGKNDFLTMAEIEQVLPEFIGRIEQVPPMFSAKKVKGKKLYELARRGIEIERKPVKVKISSLEVFEQQPNTDKSGMKEKSDGGPGTQDLGLRVSCSAGTYIRTLAEDIGRKVGVPCHLAELRRTKAGRFDISNAVSLEELEKIVEADKLDGVVVSMNEAISHLPEKKLNENELGRIAHGMKVEAIFTETDVQQVRLTNEENDLVAIGIYDKEAKKIQPKMVLLS